MNIETRVSKMVLLQWTIKIAYHTVQLLDSNSNFTSLPFFAFLVVFDDFVINHLCILTAYVLNVASSFGGDL